MTIRLLYITAPDKESALTLAHGLLGKSLIACANILDNMTSVYHWQGEIEESDEVVMLLKTVEANVSQIEQHIKTHHDYQTPCVLSLPVEKANEDFLKWVEKSCKVAY